MADAWEVRSDLALAKTPPPAVGELEAGFLGTMTSGKEKPIVASIWAVTLAEKMMPVLAAIVLDV